MTRFAGTASLVRLALRRDRLRIPVWVLALGLVTFASGAAQEDIYPTQAAIDGYAALIGQSPVTVAFAGPPVGLDTLAGIVVYEVSFTAIVGISLMAILMVSRHTRAEEESGRSELLRATEVGRHAGGAAALIAATAASLLAGAAMWLALLPTPLTSEAAALFSIGMAILGLVFAAVTLCLAQLFVHARTVTGAGLAAFGVGYVLRAAGDVREDWLVWLSPVGWVQASHVAAENLWWPLLAPAVATSLLVALAVALAERRDFGGGLLPDRAGRSTAPLTLSGTVGLAWRVQRGTVLAWSVGLLVLAAFTGSLGEAMEDMVRDNRTLADYLEVSVDGSVVDSYLATMVLILSLAVAGFAVWSAAHPGADEGAGQMELLLAGPVSRARTMGGHLLVSVISTTLVLVASGVGLGAAHALVTGELGEGWRAFGAQLAYLPAILALLGLVVALQGWLPRAIWAGWVMLAFCFVVGWLGGVLDPPGWVVNLSAFTHVPRVPIESAAAVELVVLAVVASVLYGVGVVGFRRRDVGVG